MNRTEEERAQLSAIGYEMDGTDMKMDAEGYVYEACYDV